MGARISGIAWWPIRDLTSCIRAVGGQPLARARQLVRQQAHGLVSSPAQIISDIDIEEDRLGKHTAVCVNIILVFIVP